MHQDSTERGVFTGKIRTYRVWSLDVGRYIEVNICHLSILLEGRGANTYCLYREIVIQELSLVVYDIRRPYILPYRI